MAKWEFRDDMTLDTYTFEINPNEGGSPTYVKKINFEATTAPDGQTLIYEGQADPRKMSFSGTVLTRDQYEAMVEWFGKRVPIHLTDDLGREFMIFITSFQAQRQRAVHYQWKHTYTVDATILDGDV